MEPSADILARINEALTLQSDKLREFDKLFKEQRRLFRVLSKRMVIQEKRMQKWQARQPKPKRPQVPQRPRDLLMMALRRETARLTSLPVPTCTRVLSTAFDIIKTSLEAEESVRLANFGDWYWVWLKGKMTGYGYKRRPKLRFRLAKRKDDE